MAGYLLPWAQARITHGQKGDKLLNEVLNGLRFYRATLHARRSDQVALSTPIPAEETQAEAAAVQYTRDVRASLLRLLGGEKGVVGG